MAGKVEHTEDAELTQAVKDMLDVDAFPELQLLVDNDVTILCCMYIKMGEDCETHACKGSPITLNKLSDDERLFMEGNAHYILIMDYHFWHNANDRARSATLFDALQDIEVSLSGKVIKLKKRASDIKVKHRATLARFGSYDENTILLKQSCTKVDSRRPECVEDAVVPLLTDGDEPPAEEAEKE